MRHATIVDVAKQSGFSKSTVSRVLRGSSEISEEARQSVLDAVRELGYQPNMLAGGLRTRRTYSIALIIPDIANPFFPEIARGAQKAADPGGYSILLANSDWSERRELEFLALARRNRLDGILINPASVSAQALHQVGCPVVILGSRDAYSAFDSVGSDTPAALRQVVDHLVGLGHRRVAIICGPADNPAAHKREAAFREHMAAHGLQVSDDVVAYDEFSQSGGSAATRRLIQLPVRPTALVCGNDLLAIGALAALHEAGLSIPGDVAVVGIDNIDASAVTHPPLTTVDKPKFRMGEEAAGLLIARIEGKQSGPPQHRLLPTALVVRGSTVSQERAPRVPSPEKSAQ